MRHGLRTGTGMDQVDAQQAHMISTDYDLREQRQKLLLSRHLMMNKTQSRLRVLNTAKQKGRWT
jgi:hypothetical protein